MYALSELAGQNHTKFIPEILYWYNVNGNRPECLLLRIEKDEYAARKQTPLLPLKSLDSKVEKTKNYNIPLHIIRKDGIIAYRFRKCPRRRYS